VPITGNGLIPICPLKAIPKKPNRYQKMTNGKNFLRNGGGKFLGKAGIFDTLKSTRNYGAYS
jgi:hypothetical protein